MRQLYYEGKAISSEKAHALPAEERCKLTGRKPILEKKKKVRK